MPTKSSVIPAKNRAAAAILIFLNIYVFFRVPETEQEVLDLHPLLAGELHVLEGQGSVCGGYGQVGLAVGENLSRRRVQVDFLGAVDLEHEWLLALFRYLGEGGRVWAQASYEVEYVFAAVVPVDAAGVPGEFRRRFEHFGALDEGTLHPDVDIVLDESLDRLEHKLRAYLHQFVVHIACGVLRAYAAFVAHQDAAGVDVLVYHEGGHACELLPVDHGPVDRGRSPVLRQQGGV